MRLNGEQLHELIESVENESVKNSLIESANFANLILDGDQFSKSAIFCADNDIGDKKNQFIKRIKQLFPENIIGCKTLENEEIVVLTSRSVLNVIDSTDFSIKTSMQCDYYATSLCSYIHGDSLKNLQIFIGSVEGDLIEWRLSEGNTPKRRKGHKGMIFSIAADSQHLFTISDDRTLRMWELKNGAEPLCTVYGHTARPFAICVVEASHLIFTGGIEQTIFVWKYSENTIELIRKIVLSIGTIRSIVQTSEHRLLVGSYENGLVTVNTEPIEQSVEMCKNVLNFGYIGERLVILDEVEHHLTVYQNENMSKILFRAENIRHMTSNDNSIASWNEKHVLFLSEMNVLCLKMSSNVISIICSNNYFLIKLVDGFVRLYEFVDAKNLKFLKKFKLVKPSIIPSAFVVIEDFLIFGTTHGELYFTKITISSEDVQNVVNRKISKQLFGDKEISTVKQTGKMCFMVLAKSGTWTTFSIQENEDILLLNSRNFSANMRMSWPCKFIDILSRLYIVGFHGTSLVIWDAIKGQTAFDVWCGGGHREWKITTSFESETVLHFDFIRNGSLRRQRIDLDMIEHVAAIPHCSPIVCAAGSENYLATVSLDGILSISSQFRSSSADYCINFSMFAGENLLCTDILELEDHLYIITGGGKSKFSIWKFEKEDNFRNNTFWHRSLGERTDEGRVVATKFVTTSKNRIEFVVSFSSGAIEIFAVENHEIVPLNMIRLDENVGIGSKIEVKKSGEVDNFEIVVGTSNSYLVIFEVHDRKSIMTRSLRLKDRSGVTALCLSDEEIVIGCDSGLVFSMCSTSDSSHNLHTHLSTVVGIVKNRQQIHSISLDCVIRSEGNRIRQTKMNMPGGITSITSSACIVVVGDGIETF